jgi:hypothetical protein
MNFRKHLAAGVVFFTVFAPFAAAATEFGTGYGRQFLGNTSLEQYEMVVREPLFSKTNLGGLLQVSSRVEFGMAVIREQGVEFSELGKFSCIPEVVFRPHNRVHSFVGLGAGFMGGEAEFTRHDLGGPFFLASKVGVRLLLGVEWGVEYVYYHQSNAGIYEHNASLNMQQLAVFCSF